MPCVDLLAPARGRDRVAALVQVAVVADLVAALDDARDRCRVAFRGVAGHVEGALDLVPVEDLEDAREPARHPEAPLAERAEPARVDGILAQPARFRVHVEGQRDRDLGAVWPVRSHSPVANPPKNWKFAGSWGEYVSGRRRRPSRSPSPRRLRHTRARYEVRSCGASSPQAFTLANESAATINSGSQCPQSGSQLLSGVYAGVASSGFTLAHAGASWTIAAPAGLQLDRLDVKRALGRISAAWYVTRVDAGAGARGVRRDDGSTCRLGGGGSDPIAYTGLNAPSVTFRLECLPPDDDLACVGRNNTQAWVALYSATARVSDPAPPALEPLNVSPGWQNGSEPLVVAAADASGVKSLSVSAGATKLFERQLSCTTRMQPCPASARDSVVLDASKLGDGTYDLKAVATDAADQAGTATATLKVDRHAPESPRDLAVLRNADGTLAFVWDNPDQGATAPVAAVHYEVCDALGAACTESVVTGSAIARVNSVAVPAGSHVVRVWLQDEAGNADRASAVTLTIDPASVSAPRAINLNPPVLAAADAPGFRVTSARRSGSTLTLSGTIARAASARISAKVTPSARPSATARTNPRRGRWTIKVKLTSTLRRATTFSVKLTYAGQPAFRASTIRRPLTQSPGRDVPGRARRGRAARRR